MRMTANLNAAMTLQFSSLSLFGETSLTSVASLYWFASDDMLNRLAGSTFDLEEAHRMICSIGKYE